MTSATPDPKPQPTPAHPPSERPESPVTFKDWADI